MFHKQSVSVIEIALEDIESFVRIIGAKSISCPKRVRNYILDFCYISYGMNLDCFPNLFSYKIETRDLKC